MNNLGLQSRRSLGELSLFHSVCFCYLSYSTVCFAYIPLLCVAWEINKILKSVSSGPILIESQKWSDLDHVRMRGVPHEAVYTLCNGIAGASDGS